MCSSTLEGDSDRTYLNQIIGTFRGPKEDRDLGPQ